MNAMQKNWRWGDGGAHFDFGAVSTDVALAPPGLVTSRVSWMWRLVWWLSCVWGANEGDVPSLRDGWLVAGRSGRWRRSVRPSRSRPARDRGWHRRHLADRMHTLALSRCVSRRRYCD